ncbi:hypothetical protein GSS87_01000 [Corynebacterium sp. 4HC-13]|uniref:TatD family hydrolase n=1 Tax=Corynebacterium anserum TaxID=2684406 RepID=UPI00163AB4AB|nr:TatD family hydrolase [Corynebacterium anserum]MBC2681010.1 hypothetical protein [Corynebacterium anserum]
MLLDTHYHFDFLSNQPLRAAFLDALSTHSAAPYARTGASSTHYAAPSAQSANPSTQSASPLTHSAAPAPHNADGAGDLEQPVNVVAQTLTPSDYVVLIHEAEQLAAPGRRLPLWSLGFHPWYITSRKQADAELAVFRSQLRSTRFIGEIGLDFAPRRLEQASAELQTHVFRTIVTEVCAAAGEVRGADATHYAMAREVSDRAKRHHPPFGDTADHISSRKHSPSNCSSAPHVPYVLSIHAVRASSAVIDILEELHIGRYNVAPIIHWFSGTSDELTRFIALGGYISVNHRMLATKRGRAYARQIPVERLLIETDLPESPVISSQCSYQYSYSASPTSPENSGSATAENTDTVTAKDSYKITEELAEFHAQKLISTVNGIVCKLQNIRGKEVVASILHNQQRLYAQGNYPQTA